MDQELLINYLKFKIMKSIVYILIAIIISSILISAIPMSNNKAEKIITLQCSDYNADLVMLNKSAEIIENRLKDFSSEKFDITVIPEKKQIQVVLTNNWDLKDVETLLQKGTLAFYETYNHESLSALLNGDNHLFSLLNDVVANNSDVQIGCTSIPELEKVNDYLNSVGLNQKCKFVWRQFSGNSDVCLYALKLDVEKGALLEGADIESIKFNQDNTSENYSIEIRFKKSAVEVWSNATKRNINNVIAIVLDNNVINAPVLKSVIDNGKCSITGNFTQTQVRYFAALGNNGELPLNFKIVK